jgi:hypothetical protein
MDPAMIVNSKTQLRQCTECWQVWLAADPAAGRLPRTCPNDCQAAVRGIDPVVTNIFLDVLPSMELP